MKHLLIEALDIVKDKLWTHHKGTQYEVRWIKYGDIFYWVGEKSIDNFKTSDIVKMIDYGLAHKVKFFITSEYSKDINILVWPNGSQTGYCPNIEMKFTSRRDAAIYALNYLCKKL